MAGNRLPVVGLNDRERFPLIGDLSFLMKMKQEEFAPAFNFQSGDRLDAVRLERVKQYAENIRALSAFGEKDMLPDWMNSYLTWCIETVPVYKNRPHQFRDQPTINRSHISTFPWKFVSADANLDDLLVYQTSGTTGAAMDVLFDPVSQACWLPQLQSVLDNHHINLDSGPGIVSIALICSQSATLTYASLSTYLDGAGILKINLNPGDWKHPSHRNKYLEKYNPQILTGDPFAFLDLLALKPHITPRALVSSAMKLTDGIRNKLESYFNCPVIDIYSLTECRMIAVAEGGRHRAIRPELYLEVFDKDSDTLLPHGERGELVITGGNNPFLPLIRYRTGDFCSLKIESGIPYIIDLEARLPVAFYDLNNKLINNIEVSRAMMHYPLAGFHLHQQADYKLEFTGWSNENLQAEVVRSLKNIFGEEIHVDVIIQPLDFNTGCKTVNYSSVFGMKDS